MSLVQDNTYNLMYVVYLMSLDSWVYKTFISAVIIWKNILEYLWLRI